MGYRNRGSSWTIGGQSGARRSIDLVEEIMNYKRQTSVGSGGNMQNPGTSTGVSENLEYDVVTKVEIKIPILGETNLRSIGVSGLVVPHRVDAPLRKSHVYEPLILSNQSEAHVIIKKVHQEIHEEKSMGNYRSFRALSDLKKPFNLSVLFIMETKVTPQIMELIRVCLGFMGKLVVDKVGKSGRLCLMWSKKERPSGYVDGDWWNELWKIVVPLKVQNFIWLACRNWIPTRCNLADRGVQVEVRRENVVAWAQDYLEAFRDTGKCDGKLSSTPYSSGTLIWSKPLEGVFKIDVDATINDDAHMVGVRAIVRDSSCKVVAFMVVTIAACFSPVVAEAVVILKGLRLVVDLGLLPDVLENNSKGVVNLINVDSCPMADIGVVISDIRSLLSLVDVPVSFVPRTANKVTHVLAKFALRSLKDCDWHESFPPYPESVILNDCSLSF
ncbi:hypothetical protein Ddye_021075 [Dipteronia dyeriana]|uniref:RNase H type-1 domain-containing protein n=1 Tax=Dipteronia dyeriana TaxID=168575 RepID=A0AAD9U1Y7_9ROSI|nr:hypothetical protein Ddye_021075 [Dipteronia dyeriana]